MTTETDTAPVADTREAQRWRVLDEVRTALEEAYQEVDSGPLEGLWMISRGNVDATLRTLERAELPPVDRHTGEILAGDSPALITIWAECPRCGIAQTILVAISPQLVIDPDGAELKLKAKSKGRFHACGQLTLQAKPETDQGDFGLEDILGEGDAEDEGKTGFSDEAGKAALDELNRDQDGE